MRTYLLHVTFLLALAAPGILGDGNDAPKSVVDVAVYYESLCGDSMRFIQNQLVPNYPHLKEHLNIKFIPYGKASHSREGETGPWRFTCQHGPEECRGNKAQACAIEEIQRSEKQQDRQRLAVELVGCAMSARYPPTAVPQCAQQVGLNQESQNRIVECTSSASGDDLLAAYGDMTKALQPPLSFVPTVVVNGVYSSDNQNTALRDFKGLICGLLPQNEKAATC